MVKVYARNALFDVDVRASAMDMYDLESTADKFTFSQRSGTLGGVTLSTVADFKFNYVSGIYTSEHMLFNILNAQIDGQDNLIGGTINAIINTSNTASGTAHVNVVLSGLSIDGVAMRNAMGTQSASDEFAIYKSAFAGADTFDLSNHHDKAEGWGGNDTLRGYAGNDTLDGGTGADRIEGGSGWDRLIGGDGTDKIYGGTWSDVLLGGAKADQLWGGDGNDKLEGNYGWDKLYGGRGNDRLYGGADNDVLDGGKGHDKLYGGTGADRFVFHLGDGNDTIYGFESGRDVVAIKQGNTFELSASGGDAILTNDDAIITFIGMAGEQINLIFL